MFINIIFKLFLYHPKELFKKFFNLIFVNGFEHNTFNFYLSTGSLITYLCGCFLLFVRFWTNILKFFGLWILCLKLKEIFFCSIISSGWISLFQDGRLTFQPGSQVVKLPFINFMRAHGTTFLNAYTNSPICCPSRAGMNVPLMFLILMESDH